MSYMVFIMNNIQRTNSNHILFFLYKLILQFQPLSCVKEYTAWLSHFKCLPCQIGVGKATEEANKILKMTMTGKRLTLCIMNYKLILIFYFFWKVTDNDC